MTHGSAPRYPATRYEPSPLVDLSTRSERERLSPGAIKAFFNIMAKWGVRDEDARALLGGISNGQFYEMKKNPERTLDVDALTRISYLIGIFKALNILYSEKLADAWVQRATARGIARPSAMTGAYAPRCNIFDTISASDEDAARQTR